MRKSLLVLLAAILCAVSVQGISAAPVLAQSEGSSNVRSGGDSPEELRTYFAREFSAMMKELASLRQEVSAMRSEMTAMRTDMAKGAMKDDAMNMKK